MLRALSGGSFFLKRGLDPSNILSELLDLISLTLMELQETQQYQGEMSWEGEGVGFHSLDMVYDYEGKVVTLEELECYTPHI